VHDKLHEEHLLQKINCTFHEDILLAHRILRTLARQRNWPPSLAVDFALCPQLHYEA
jgi:hypothetical protein